MDVTVSGMMSLPAGVLSREAVSDLRLAMRYSNPDRRRDDFAPAWIYGMVEGFRTLEIHRGAVSKLKRVARAHGIKLTFIDERSSGTSAEFNYTPPGKLTEYQLKASDLLRKKTQGVVTIPTGGGKTAVAMHAIAQLGERVIVFVHTRDLLDQWVAAAKKQLGVDAGPDGPINVVTVQSLQTVSRMRVARLTAQYGVCVVDEGHHIPAWTFQKILSFVSSKWRWALTATPERPDGLEQMLYDTIGPVLLQVPFGDVVEAGRVVRPEIFKVMTGITYTSEDYMNLLADIAEDEQRTRHVARFVVDLVRGGRRVIVLSLRVALCDDLGEAISQMGVRVETVHGTVTKRAEKLARFASGETSVLCATTIADEGLDIPTADTLVMTTPSRAKGRTVQRVGRVLRSHGDKLKPLVFDLVDDHKTAKSHWTGRRRAYLDTYGDGCISAKLVELSQLSLGGHGWIGTNSES